MEAKTFFPYSWYIDDDEEEVTSMRIYGLDSDNKNVCVKINNFTPFVYVELPENITWTMSKAKLVTDKIDFLLKERKPIQKELIYKKRLYYAHLSSNKERKTFPYLFLSFSTQSDIKNLYYKIRKPMNIIGVGPISLKIHESDASPILQFTSYRNISTAGWADFVGKKIPDDEKVTRCDYEYSVMWKNVKPNKSNSVAKPKILGFDIEVNSTNPSAMPKATRPGDKVFQISCVLYRHGDPESNMEKYLLTLGYPDQKTVGKDVEIQIFDTEHDLIVGFTEFIQEHNPNIIVGYNILNFDIPYLIDRAKYLLCIDVFDQMGFTKNKHAKEKTIKWSSSAYGSQTFQFLDAEGIVFVDLLPLVKRDYKMDNYKLKTISTFFIGATKDPLSVKGIFKCYRIGIKHDENGVYSKKAQNAMGIVGKYCFAEGTMVSSLHGNVPIEKLINSRHQVLSWNSKTDTIEIAQQVNFFNNGVQQCIELELEDGRKITCTPDHLIANEKGKWIASKDSLDMKIKVGAILPTIEADTQDMILSRIIGYLLSSGYIGKNCIAYFVNLIDAEIFAKDIHVLSGILPLIEKDDNCYVVDIPTILSEKIIKILENESLSDMILWNENSVKELLAGLFGGDKSIFSITDNKFDTVKISYTHSSKQNVIDYLNMISDYMKKFNILSYSRITQQVEDVLFLGYLNIDKNSLETFMNMIGYRYSYHKTMMATIATVYYRIKWKFQYERKKVYESIKYLVTNGSQIQHAYNQVIDFIKTKEYMPSLDTIKNYIYSDSIAIINDKKFPSASEFIDIVDAQSIYLNNFRHESHIPTFSLKVVNIKKVGKKQVYDIQVNDTHAYMAEGIVAHNCVQDSVLVISLLNKLQTWIGLCEMANVCNVPIFYLYTQGQQIKVYSQLYKFCMYNNFVVEKDGYIPKDDEHYVGASVVEPVPGVYDRVIPFDFSSLYPSTIIAYNIDYSTLVIDPKIPDKDCHIMEWEDHVGCPHDTMKRKTKVKHVMCCKRYFRFLKEPRGVMPTVLQNLLDARANTRNQMKVIKKFTGLKDEEKLSEKDAEIISKLSSDLTKESAEILYDVLDKRQLAFKVSANSMYGAMGVTRGYLPFMPGAMATTAMGRKNIAIAIRTIVDQYNAHLVYSDTDSAYVMFKHLNTAQENWDHAIFVAKEVSKIFPEPISLAFEMSIYWKFFILTKKRYMYQRCERDGIIEDHIGKKGVLLARRDNSMFIRNAYEHVINMIFEKHMRDEILFYVINEINNLCSHFYSYKNFVVTKSIGEQGDGTVVPFIDKKGRKKGKMGSYTVPLLSTDETERKRQFKLKDCNNSADYYKRCLPAVVQLAEKMRERGQRVDVGTRLEYVISDQGGHKAKQYAKVEDAGYFAQHSTILKIDYMYYMKLMANPFDDIFNILYSDNKNSDTGKAFTKDFVLNQYKYRLNVRAKVHEQLLKLFQPRLIFRE